MTTVAPALKINSIFDGVRDLLLRAPKFIPADDFQFRLLLAEANKLIKADPAYGHLAVGYVKHVIGDIAPVRDHIINAIRLGVPWQEAKELAVGCFINLGYFTEAQQYFVECADPQLGRFTYNYNLGMSCGAFRQTSDFEESAMRMQIDLEAIPLHERCVEAVRVLNKTNSTDEQVRSLLDIAGEVMRKNKLFFIGDTPEFCVIDDPRTGCCVHLIFHIAEPPETVSELMFELAEAAAERLDSIPLGFSVGFTSTVAA